MNGWMDSTGSVSQPVVLPWVTGQVERDSEEDVAQVVEEKHVVFQQNMVCS